MMNKKSRSRYWIIRTRRCSCRELTLARFHLYSAARDLPRSLPSSTARWQSWRRSLIRIFCIICQISNKSWRKISSTMTTHKLDSSKRVFKLSHSSPPFNARTCTRLFSAWKQALTRKTISSNVRAMALILFSCYSAASLRSTPKTKAKNSSLNASTVVVSSTTAHFSRTITRVKSVSSLLRIPSWRSSRSPRWKNLRLEFQRSKSCSSTFQARQFSVARLTHLTSSWVCRGTWTKAS